MSVMNEPVRSTGSCERVERGVRVWGIRRLSFAAWARGLALVVLLGMLGAAGAQAAPRDLVEEFMDALFHQDVKQVKALLKEGLTPSDAVDTCIVAFFMGADAVREGDNVKIGEQSQANIVEIIRAVAEAGGDFSSRIVEEPGLRLPSGKSYTPSIFPLSIFKALLEAAKQHGNLDREFYQLKLNSIAQELLFDEEYKKPGYKGREKVTLIAKAGIKLNSSLMERVLSDCLDEIHNESQKDTYDAQKTKIIVENSIDLINFLKKTGVIPPENRVKLVLGNYRKTNRNKPELLAFADELEKACATSWLDSFRFW